MRPFNLEAALRGEKVVTRDGREVTQLVKFDAKAADWPIAGVVENQVRSWTDDGGFMLGGVKDHYLDLFMAPVKKTGWINVYSRALVPSRYHTSTEVYLTKEEALLNNAGMVATIQIEWHE